jgi:MFS transporter, DHA2 family, multidrug resistance protein
MATYPTGATRAILVTTAVSCAILELIDSTVVNVSLREISGSIGATTTEIAWVITAYSIANVIVIPLSGMLSNFFGRKNYFTSSVLLFTFASLMCGISTNLWLLVFWRFIQGLGGGGLISTAQSIIMDAFPPDKRTTGLMVFGLGIIVGPSFGPVLGGYITDNFSWHWIFFVNLPIGALASFLSWKYVPDIPGVEKPRIDWLGILFLVIGIGCLQYVLEEGSTDDWFDSNVITTCFITGLLFMAAFVIRELRISYPAVNLRLYRNYNLALGNSLNLLLGLILNATLYAFPLFTQLGLNWTATKTGAFMIPGALVAIPAMITVKTLLDNKGMNPKIVMILGMVMTIIPLVILSYSSGDSSNKDFFWPFILRGFGSLFMVMPILSLATVGLTGKDLAQAIGLSNMLRQLGAALGVALMGVFINHETANVRGNMINNISEYNPTSVDALNAYTQTFRSAGYGPEEATAAAYKLADAALTKQQLLVSYDHSFLVAALMVLIALPVVLAIRYKKKPVSGEKKSVEDEEMEMAH